MQGTVKFFNKKRGYGFIRSDNGKDAFVHFSNISMEGSRILNLKTGDTVEYEEVPDAKGLRAVNMKLVYEV